MRKGILILGIAVLLLTALSSFAYSRYHSTTTMVCQKTICLEQINDSGETIFESMVKHFVGAVKVGN
jgi:hypothetical protein